MNRLSEETSPYLRQHADNPIHWFAWGDEALAKAKAEDKFILVSIGYSSCHWCHVMAHESFEDTEVADFLNENFVCIKVDREERPDVDALYMHALQAMNQNGGWPLTMYCTPDARPFLGGTYYPKDHFLAQSKKIIEYASGEAKAEILSRAEQLTEYLTKAFASPAGFTMDPGSYKEQLAQAATGISQYIDLENGGIKNSPKFPHPLELRFALHYGYYTKNEELKNWLATTLYKMGSGGIYDQVGGGFARYSVDEEWVVPHFEKMLYDNAQLCLVYAEHYAVTKDEFSAGKVSEILDYLLKEMYSPNGGFYAATDADSEGVEGKFFVWSLAEFKETIGADQELAAQFFGVTEEGNFEGSNIPVEAVDRAEFGAKHSLSSVELATKIGEWRSALYSVRDKRTKPGLDDKILTSWNALLLSALGLGGLLLNRSDYKEAADALAEYLWQSHRNDDGLLHNVTQGSPGSDAFLEDYTYLTRAYLDLYGLFGDRLWLRRARELLLETFDRFGGEGALFATNAKDSAQGRQLIIELNQKQDGVVPAGNSVMAEVLIRMYRLTFDKDYMVRYQQLLTGYGTEPMEFPLGSGAVLWSMFLAVAPGSEIVVHGPRQGAEFDSLMQELAVSYDPIRTVSYSDGFQTDDPDKTLLQGKHESKEPLVYICESGECHAPISWPELKDRQEDLVRYK